MRTFARKKIIFLLASVVAWSWQGALIAAAGPVKQHASEAKSQPSIQVKEPLYNFGSIMEGTVEVEHQFVVKNTGTEALKIDKVQVGCGCTLVKYDSEIPPGEEGKVIMKLNLRTLQGRIVKTAVVQSNDPHTPELTLTMEGSIAAIIAVKPSTNILFKGMADQLPESILEIKATSEPFHITGIMSDLDENIKYSVETVSEGKHYRLRVANQTTRGNYSGYIKLTTDLEQKPDIVVRVLGFVEGEVSVRPQNILIGKLMGGQPERTAKLVVVSNRDQPFEIKKLIYDKELMSVSISKEPLEAQKGFILEVKPKLGSIPAGKRKQTNLEIETDIKPDEKIQVMVNVLNNSDPADAAQNK